LTVSTGFVAAPLLVGVAAHVQTGQDKVQDCARSLPSIWSPGYPAYVEHPC
jgi:hypothetical protein